MANWWESAPVVEDKSTTSSTPEWLKNAPLVEQQEPRSVTITPDRQRAAPIGEGERQAVADKALVEKMGGSATEAALMSGANMALFNIPSHVAARYRASKEGRPYAEVYKEQKEYEAALSRYFPKASTAGDVVGFGAGMFVPLGPLAKVGQATGAIGAKLGPSVGRVAEIAGTSAAASGVSSAIESGDVQDALKSAGIGAAAGAGLGAAGQKFSNWLSRKPDAFVDGKPTQETLDAFKAAFGEKLSPEDLNLASEKVMGVLSQKGPSKASMVEALALEEGLPVSRALSTGTRPSEAAAPYAEKARVEAQDKLRENLAGVIGKPGEVSVPSALLEAEAARRAKASGQFEAIKETPGEFVSGQRIVEKPLAEGEAPRAKPAYTQQRYDLGDLIEENVRKSLAQAEINFPSNLASEPGYDKAAAAQRYLFDKFRSDTMPIGGRESPWDLKNIMFIHQQLNVFGRAAGDSKERAAVSAIRRGYEDAINDAVAQKLFTGDGAAFVEAWAKSKKDWADYRRDFYPSKSVEAAGFNSILKSMVDENGKLVSDLNPSLERAANFAVNSTVINKKIGQTILDRLENVLGKDSDAMTALNQQIRQKMLDVGGDLSKAPKAIEKFLSPENIDLAKRVLPPRDGMTTGQQISQLRRIKVLMEKLNASSMPDEQKQSFLLRALRGLPTLIGGALGYPHGMVATAAAALAGKSLGDIGEGIAKSRQVGAEAFGAPVYKQPFEMPAVPEISGVPSILQPRFMPSVRNVETFEDPANYQLPPMVPARPGRADGGKVMGAEGHADRLVAMAEKAKHNLGKETKPLLNAPDEHIAKALEIANRHI